MVKIKGNKLFIFFLLLFVFLLGASFVFAAIELPTEEKDIAKYIKYVFNFSIAIGALLAFGALIYGGILYLTSVGDPERIRRAKDQISAAFLGLIILLSSYLILINLNPQLIILKSLTPSVPEKVKPPTIPPVILTATCDAVPTFENDLLETINFNIGKAQEILEIVDKAETLYQKTKDIVNSVEGCSCSKGCQISCKVCESLVPVYCNCPNDICSGLRGIIQDLRNEIEGGEIFVMAFEKEPIEILIKSDEIEPFETTLQKMNTCHLDYDQSLYICEQAKYLEFVESCDNLDFYCCY